MWAETGSLDPPHTRPDPQGFSSRLGSSWGREETEAGPCLKAPTEGSGAGRRSGQQRRGPGPGAGAGVEEAVRGSQAVGALYACHILPQKDPS